MSATSAHSVLSESKRLITRAATRLRASARGLFALLLAAIFCTLASACSDDSSASANATHADQDSTANSSTPLAQQFNQSNQSNQGPVALPANTIQTPPPPASQLGAAAPASDSLAPPVIHTVD